MTSEIRRRGRPCGTGKNDTSHLRRVADLLIENPKMTATSAMKQILRTDEDNTATLESRVRRLQGKWRREKEVHLSDARARMRACTEVRRAQVSGARLNEIASALGVVQSGAIAQIMKAASLAESPASRAFKMLHEDQERWKNLLDPSGIRKMLEQHRKLEDVIRGPLFGYSQLDETIKKLTRPLGI